MSKYLLSVAIISKHKSKDKKTLRACILLEFNHKPRVQKSPRKKVGTEISNMLDVLWPENQFLH